MVENFASRTTNGRLGKDLLISTDYPIKLPKMLGNEMGIPCRPARNRIVNCDWAVLPPLRHVATHTRTTVITFLLVFLIQNTQNRKKESRPLSGVTGLKRQHVSMRAAVELVRILELNFVVLSPDDERGIEELPRPIPCRFADVADLGALLNQ